MAHGQRVPGEEVQPGQLFRVASLSKLLTAAVLLQLVEEGAVGLDEPVGQLVADQLDIGPVSERTAAVTPRRLLSHTSGFGKDRSRYFGGGLGKDWRLNAAAGLAAGSSGSTGFVYSNTNYVIAGVLIEALTWQFYPDAVTERLLAPLGIDGARLGSTQSVGVDEVLHRSDHNRSYVEALGPAGGWVASAADIALVLDSLNASSGSWHPVSDEMLALMADPVSPGPLPGGGYGLGLMRAGDGSIGHTGSIQQTRAMAMARPDGTTWVILVNGTNPDSPARLQAVMERALATRGP